MEIKRIWEIYFSPTGTTKKTVHTIASALRQNMPSVCLPCEIFDFTLPKARAAFPELHSGDLVIFGCPTYAGRLPNLLLKYLDTIAGGGAAAVAVVTFGNRNFDNSLSELCHILNTHGFHTAAAAAFSCEHSFSRKLGAGRPDEKDQAEMEAFASKICNKIFSSSPLISVSVPGKTASENFGGYYQPQDRHGVPIDIRKVKPLTSESCTHCGHCAEICPMGSIDPDTPEQVPGICIKCGACIKGCPVNAKYYDDPGYLYHKSELEEVYRRRAENHIFL